MLEYPKFVYGFMAVLGIVFLALAIEGAYLSYYKVSILSFLSGMAPSNFGLDFVLGGITLLTIGILGNGKQYFKDHRKLFTVLGILLVPLLIFASFVVG